MSLRASRNTIYFCVVLGAILVCGGFALKHRSGQIRQWVAGDRRQSRALAERTAAARKAAQLKKEKLLRRGAKPFDKPQQAHEFFLKQRLAPGQKRYPIEHLREQLLSIQQREGQRRAAGALPPNAGSIESWTELGPGNIGGRTRAIVFDPDNPEIMYAGGVAGGIWKTTNGGLHWDATDDLMLNLAVSTMAIDPTNPNILYAGTGEGFFQGIHPNVAGLGIFKSEDAGGSWTQLPGTVEGVPQDAFQFVNKIVISPNNSNHVYAATRFGVWRSLDAGQNWSLVLANPFYAQSTYTSNGSIVGCTELAVRPSTNPDVLFAAFGSFQADGLFRSDDGGDTWIPYTVPANQGRMTLSVAPSNDAIIYILMADNGLGGQTGQLVNVYRSDDGGLSWAGQVNFDSLMGPWLLSNLIVATGCVEYMTYSQGWYDNIIAVDPVDPDIVWVGGVDLFRSDDGGQNFGVAGYWLFYMMEVLPPFHIHPDFHNIVFHPQYDGSTNQIMYVTNDGGIFRTANARAAVSQEDCPMPEDEALPEVVWEIMNNNYGVTQFYHGDSAKEADIFVGGAQDNGTSRVQAADTPNDWDLILGGDGGYVAIDPANSDIMYAEIQFFPTLRKSVDGGETFVEVTEGITDTDGLFITPFILDPANPEVLWTGGRRPWRTTDGAASWHNAGPDFAGPGTISALAIAPSDSNILYLGFDNGYIVRTNNALDESPLWSVFVNGLQPGYVSSVAIDPVDPDIAYCTYATFGVAHVLRTVDGGLNWTSIDNISAEGIPDIPVHWVAVRPCDSQQLYAGTELGVFATHDAGQRWEPVNQGMAHTVVESLDFKNDNTLVAFTHGRGAFLASLSPCPGCFADLNGDAMVNPADLAQLLGAWGPNPGHAADLNDDGQVDGADLAQLLGAWGTCPI